MIRPRAALGVLLAALAAALPGPSARALAPHELLLLVNARSPASRALANRYIEQRRLPLENVVYLPLPDKVLEPAAQCTPQEFTEWIWEPAWNALRERQLENRILAWAYSADFPVRVTTTPAVSLQGLTFLRNLMPESGLVVSGQWASVFFRGPAGPGGPQGEPVSLEVFKQSLRDPMPLPSMMLAYTGARGLLLEEAQKALDYGRLSDGSRPGGKVFFVTSPDVRSKAREWQYPGACAELQTLGVSGVITSNAPAAQRGLAGIMAGTATLDPRAAGAFAPGAMADHLTSWAALFHNPAQTKMTEWLMAGATTSAGTVVEPLSIWTKFPHARFFVHYASGCTALESYALSLACPLQTLLLGDPLAAPWAARRPATLVLLEDDPVQDQATFMVSSLTPGPAAGHLYFLDGAALNPTPAGPQLTLKADALADGYHEMRVAVLTQAQGVRFTSEAVRGFSVRRVGRALRIQTPAPRTEVDETHPLTVEVAADGDPASWQVQVQGQPAAPPQTGSGGRLAVDLSPFGPGPVTLQAVARYADGMTVRSEPCPLVLKNLNRPPVVTGISIVKDPAPGHWTARVEDPDGDPLQGGWYRPLPLDTLEGSVQGSGPGTALLRPVSTNAYTLCRMQAPLAEAYRMDLALPPLTPAALGQQLSGLVYDWKDEANFSFFGLDGAASAWSFGACRNGKITMGPARGIPLRGGRTHRLEVRRGASGAVEGWVDDRKICEQNADGKKDWTGALGVVTGRAPTAFGPILRRLPSKAPATAAAGPRALEAPEGEEAPLVLWVADPWATVWKETP